jgi:hypothetical protein
VKEFLRLAAKQSGSFAIGRWPPSAIGHPDDLPKRWANGQKQSLDHYQAASTNSHPGPAMYATAALDGPVSEGDHPEVSESGLRDA